MGMLNGKAAIVTGEVTTPARGRAAVAPRLSPAIC